MSQCLNVTELPENIGDLEFLETLDLFHSGIKALPSSINQLENLVSLSCIGCKGLTLPPLTEDKDEDRIENCLRIEKFLNFSNCFSLDKKKVMKDVLKTHLLKHKIVRLCIPGDEVPQRMRYKNQSGSSLSFTLDQPNLIGVSLCLVFDPKNYYGYGARFNCEAQFIDTLDTTVKFPSSVSSLIAKLICWNQNMCTFGMNCSTFRQFSMRPHLSSPLRGLVTVLH
ncbi:hypothetical protein GH714_019322 [Hevea brasiliensis]|uniref:Disease resistance R13L4/SHOC-2-like LRR domain-containing protein n=1 Tax=Hevea brasiliensis TaxID=3981 RepID=A0A6A6N5I7_HEVBR|nr:hypothetical protein GH714_019322 [Hevea brasiliensis]